MEESPKEPNEAEGEARHSAHFIRHSKANYASYEQVASSDDPTRPVNIEGQVVPDLTESGVELAKQEAQRFFAELDPNRDELFFTSSNEVRALETAQLYKIVAKEKGFTIHTPEHVRGELAEDIGEGDVWVIDALSLNTQNVLVNSAFSPEAQLSTLNVDGLDEETRDKWQKARAIVNADDKGSWGANYFAHSEELKQIFPEIETSEELYAGRFQKLLKLALFGFKKADEATAGKNIRILAFGHENYMGYALNKYFDEHELKNCEVVTIEQSEKEMMTIERREITKEIH